MSRPFSLAAIATLLILLGACSEQPPEPRAPSARPVKTLEIGALGHGGPRYFPGRIDAGRKASLAFRVPGTVQELLIKEGDRVWKDQVVAKLDNKDYQLVVNDRQTTYQNARKNYQRGKELVGKGAISRRDFDQLEADFKNTRTALEAARQDLSYTELKAPFDGLVAKRHIDAFEEVQAKQEVLEIQDTSHLEVKFDVPERMVRNLRKLDEEGRRIRDRIPVSVTFEGQPDKSYTLSFKEVSTRADAQTQTFEVTYDMDKPSSLNVLPGMTATVAVDLSELLAKQQAIRVPVAAVVGDVKLAPQVWVVDTQKMSVQPRDVEVGAMQGGSIEIREGLAAGDRVVVAGAPFLTDGMPVTLMPDIEQAAPRTDDPR